jgi:hypothetical protein
VRRALTTATGVGLFVMAVVVALEFDDPLQGPPTPLRTAQLFLALAALWPAGLTAYLAGRGQYRGATAAACAAGVLYITIAVLQAPRVGVPLVAALAGAALLGLLLVRARR